MSNSFTLSGSASSKPRLDALQPLSRTLAISRSRPRSRSEEVLVAKGVAKGFAAILLLEVDEPADLLLAVRPSQDLRSQPKDFAEVWPRGKRSERSVCREINRKWRGRGAAKRCGKEER